MEMSVWLFLQHYWAVNMMREGQVKRLDRRDIMNRRRPPRVSFRSQHDEIRSTNFRASTYLCNASHDRWLRKVIVHILFVQLYQQHELPSLRYTELEVIPNLVDK